MIMVFHGVLRNADEYRDDAKGMGDRFGALIVAPKFDTKTFPAIKYNRGGVLREDGTIAPRKEWTWSLIAPLANKVRILEKRPKMPYYLIGHSAGGQFVGRMAAFVSTGASGLVTSNPSSYLLPDRDQDFGYGFKNLADEFKSDEAFKAYLAQPLTIYLGTKDTERDEYFDKSPEADLQGKSRFDRGRNAYLVGKALAQKHNWPFGWRIVEASGVDHDHLKMFDHPQCATALFGEKAK